MRSPPIVTLEHWIEEEKGEGRAPSSVRLTVAGVSVTIASSFGGFPLELCRRILEVFPQGTYLFESRSGQHFKREYISREIARAAPMEEIIRWPTRFTSQMGNLRLVFLSPFLRYSICIAQMDNQARE
jgi:hypothetical protein